MNIVRTLCTAATIAGLGTTVTLQTGCNADKHRVAKEPVAEKVDLTLETPRTAVAVGDTATVTARSKDTYGRNATVKWMTTGGKLTTEENGRLARVKFDTPGTYTVTAYLMVDGQEVKRDSVNIEVRPTT